MSSEFRTKRQRMRAVDASVWGGGETLDQIWTFCPLCIDLDQQEKPTNNSSSGRRWLLLFIGGVLTAVLIVGMIVAYGRLIEKERNRRRSNPTEASNESSEAFGGNVRRALQRINWNPFGKRVRFNFFSITNNNSGTSSSHLRQNENPDEALLFDDPYADAGLHGSSANPYKSLTLAVT